METEPEFEFTEDDSPVVLDEVKLHQIVSEGSLHFDEWTSLIAEIENTCPDNVERICLVYDSFLSVFPLCYGYWRKYVHHKMRLCTVEEVVGVFERSALSATHCVDMWVDYCNFGRLVFEDQSDVRRLFKRAISFVGRNYLCHALWDKYIDFELSLKDWSLPAHLYIQALRFPTKKLHHYYENFKKLVEIWESGIKCHIHSTVTVAAEPIPNNKTSICYNQDDLTCIIKDLLGPSSDLKRLKALHKYKSLGKGLFQEAVQLYEKVNIFEARIKRSYFHVKPLDVSQLQNWHDYLDFAESHGDFDWAVQLYERCLIPCANFPEFWMRYVDFLERKGGREIANYALDRATQIHLKRLSVIHLFNARFKEHIGDVFNARAAFLQCNTTLDKGFVENVVMRANMEKRLGNSIAASRIYKDAIKTATAKEKWDILPDLYIHFSRLKYNITNSQDAAIDILIDGINHLPSCKLLIEELVKFGIMHGGSRLINLIDSIVATAISPRPSGSQGLSPEDAEEISKLHLEFVDLCGTVCEVRKAWNRHIRLFPSSVRDKLFYPAMEARKWKLALEAQEKTRPNPPIEKLPSTANKADQTADPVTDDEVLQQKLQLPENRDVGPTPLSERESPLVENLDELSEKAKTDLLQSRESDKNSHVDAYQVALDGSDVVRENIIDPKLSSDLEHQIANETDNTRASQVQTEDSDKIEQDLKLPSLETLTLDTQDANAVQRSPPVPEKTCLPDGSLLQSAKMGNTLSNPVSPRASDSSLTNVRNDCPSSLATLQNLPGDDALPWPSKQASGKKWHQSNNSNKFGRDSKFGFRGHSHKRQQHRHRHSSPQRTHHEDYRSHHGSSQNPERQGGQVDSQDWLMHSQSQQPTQAVVYPQQQIPQYSIQGTEAQQNLQNNQAYNEAWQYYYYQQQLMWQQQVLQQQQQQGQQLSQQEVQQQQQLLQHQYQQQWLQMQYYHQQQQQPQISYQQQEGQLQQQPYQLQQPQPQHLLYLQQQQQYYQQQTASSQQDSRGQEQGQSKQQTETSEIQDGVRPSRNAGEPLINESAHPESPTSMA